MGIVQRRRWDRYRVALDVLIQTPDGREIAARTQDVCEGGLGVICDETLPSGADYGFLIAVIDETPLAGAVRWCTPSAALGANLIGVELTTLTARQTEALAERIAQWKAEDATRDA